MNTIEFLHKLSSDVRNIEWQNSIKDVHIKALKEKVAQYEEITDINASKLPKFGNSLKSLMLK